MPTSLPTALDFQGRRFLRARMEKPYVDVVAQYREDKPRDAGHLFIYADGRQVLAHDDKFNPDTGALSALAHFVVDDFDTFKDVLIWGIVGAVLGWSIARRSES